MTRRPNVDNGDGDVRVGLAEGPCTLLTFVGGHGNEAEALIATDTLAAFLDGCEDACPLGSAVEDERLAAWVLIAGSSMASPSSRELARLVLRERERVRRCCDVVNGMGRHLTGAAVLNALAADNPRPSWQARAEVAEAAIARAEDLCEAAEGFAMGTITVGEIRAALRGGP